MKATQHANELLRQDAQVLHVQTITSGEVWEIFQMLNQVAADAVFLNKDNLMLIPIADTKIFQDVEHFYNVSIRKKQSTLMSYIV